VLRSVVRHAGIDAVRAHWPGTAVPPTASAYLAVTADLGGRGRSAVQSCFELGQFARSAMVTVDLSLTRRVVRRGHLTADRVHVLRTSRIVTTRRQTPATPAIRPEPQPPDQLRIGKHAHHRTSSSDGCCTRSGCSSW
jgi:hypothetical protein